MKKIIIPLFITSILFSSCMTMKKHEQALDVQNSGWTKKYDKLQSEYDALNKEKERLLASSSEALEAKEKELARKEKEIQDREKKVKELRLMISAERNAIASLKAEVSNALKGFTPEELQVQVRNGKLYVSLSDKLLFPSGSDVVNVRGESALSMLAGVLANSDLEIMVEGHTDTVPISTARNYDNWDLSVHRATSVARIMIENGIPPQRIVSCGRGEFMPVADNRLEGGRQLNRRTEIILSPRLDKLWELTEDETVSGY